MATVAMGNSATGRKSLFNYAILFHDPQGTKLLKSDSVLASGEREVFVLASRQIPEEYIERVELIEVAVRPF